jgi:hypothetical protein
MAIRLNKSQAAKLGLVPKRSKYRAAPTIVDGIRFASKKEARRYSELKMLEKAGIIKSLRLQPRFDLTTPGGNKVGEYVGDFAYRQDGEAVIEDVKGFRTPLYRWKKKHFEVQYGIQIQEV